MFEMWNACGIYIICQFLGGGYGFCQNFPQITQNPLRLWYSFNRLKNFRLSSFRCSVQTGFRTIQVENQWSCFTIFGVPIRLCAFGGSASSVLPFRRNYPDSQEILSPKGNSQDKKNSKEISGKSRNLTKLTKFSDSC